MDLLGGPLEEYISKHSEPENQVLQELQRETHLKVMMPQMLSGHLQGRVLSMLSHLRRPKRILEIGTYTGYSAICMAEGLHPEGKLITIDINKELKEMQDEFWGKSGLSAKIERHVGNALNIIPELDDSFDMVFIDADKVNYSKYYDLIFDKLSSHSFIIADNVLWSGKVVKEEKPDKDTRALQEFNNKVQNDERVENVLFPIRDGLMIVRKK